MFKNHPKGLLLAALSNMGERFGYYIMNAVLALFLCSKFGLSDEKSGFIAAMFLTAIYVLSLVGGIIADRTQNYKGTIAWGLVVMAAGYILLAIPVLATPDNISWLMNLAIMTGSDATDRLAELYRTGCPLEFAYAEISGDNWPLPILPLSVLFEVEGEDGGPGHFLLQAPREAREALQDYDWDLAAEKARAQESLVSTLNLACEMYGIVFFDEFSEQLGFKEFADTFGTKFANALLSRIVTLSMNNIVSFGVFHQSDGSVFFAHNCMRPFLTYADSANAVSDLADNPVVSAMLKSREAYPARPLGDWGEASDLYEFMYQQEPTRRLVQFLDAHVPDSQDGYEFADTVMQDEIDVNRLVRIDTDNALEDLQETYDFNADEEALEELTEILDAFSEIVPSWYYYGWSSKDASEGAFHA